MKQFVVPAFYRSSIIGKVKDFRKKGDPRKKDFSPTTLDFGNLKISLARHFGFCYGVENAIEISYKAIEENPDKQIYLLSQMIHNQQVNNDLQERGVKFLMDTEGKELIPLDVLKPEDIVIIPAFGTTLEMEKLLVSKGIEIQKYNTTCPFVEKVWNRSEKLGEEGYTIIIHGKERHEETRATFSHSSKNAASIVVRDIAEAQKLADYITGKSDLHEFLTFFEGRFSAGFDAERDLQRIGVVNQTTMLATETQAIAEFLKSVMREKYGEAELRSHFADTRDTLCYATNDNQQATYALLQENADLAIVIGGYNSSNTSHLVELCEEKLPTYFVNSADEIISNEEIFHFDIHAKERKKTSHFLPEKRPLHIILSSGASCPDALVEEVLLKLLDYTESGASLEQVMHTISQ
jgi:4-hydroxy-3-methylbut-2-enyl diphosphate reductase